jgi:photosystem II stability/assembly factor-like uncharacterized protein
MTRIYGRHLGAVVAPLTAAVAVTTAVFANAFAAGEQDKGKPNAAASAASWKAVGWGGGGLFWAAVFHPVNPQVIYMGGDVAGVYKTEDAGKNWRLINNGLSNYAVYSMAISTKDPETVFALTTNGLCKSIDGGANWRLLPETPKAKRGIVAERNKSVRAVAVDPTDSNILYAGTPKGSVFKSVNGGETWQEAYKGQQPGPVFSVAVSPRNPSVVVAASGGDGILISRDRGATWKPASAPTDAQSVAVSASDPNVLYAAFAKEGVYRSTDGGQNWTACGTGIDAQAKPIELAINPQNPQDVYCIATAGWAGRVYSSQDGGQTWTENHRMRPDYQANPTLPGDPQAKGGGTLDLSKPTNLAISPTDPSRLFIAANWRPAFSEDGGRSWSERVKGADISVVYDIRFSGPRTYVSVMDEGVLKSEDQGATWNQLWPRAYDVSLSGHFWRLSVFNAGGNDRLISTSSPWDKPADQVVVSDDGGKTFTASRQGFPEKRPTTETMWGQGYMRALAPDPKDPKVLYAGIDGDPSANGTGGGIFKSVDGGKTWLPLPNQPPSRRMFFGLAVDPTDSKRLYWGTCGKEGGLYRSDDGGEHWTRVFQQETWIFNVLVAKDGTVYCPGKNLWRSTDHGQTWTQLTRYNDNYQTVGLEADPRDPQVLWISRITWGEDALGNILKTTDGGKTWTDITGDIPYRKPLILRFNPEANELWAGGVGLFKLKQ